MVKTLNQLPPIVMIVHEKKALRFPSIEIIRLEMKTLRFTPIVFRDCNCID